jgi:hypothetical protein
MVVNFLSCQITRIFTKLFDKPEIGQFYFKLDVVVMEASLDAANANRTYIAIPEVILHFRKSYQNLPKNSHRTLCDAMLSS